MDKLICFGSAVKALGDGRVEGHLVVFGDAEQTDITALRDYFTPDTDFGIEEGAKTKVWYRHALNPNLDRVIGEGTLKVDDVGVFIEAQLNLRDRYVKAVYEEMAVKGSLGWSSGSVKHLIRREEQENGSHKITRWPLGLDASITPDPAEPRTQVVAMKSLVEVSDPFEEIASSLKAQYLGEYVEREMTMAALRELNSALMYSVVWRCLYDEEMTAEQKREKLAGAFAEFASIATETLSGYLDSAEGTAEAMKALRILWGSDRPDSFSDHAAKVASASADLANRLASRLETRQRDGRTLSQADQDALKTALAPLEELDAVRAQLVRTLAAAEGCKNITPDDVLLREKERLSLSIKTQLATIGIR